MEWSCTCGCGIYTHRAKTAEMHLQTLEGPLGELAGLAPATALLLYGGRGGGKSTIALMSFKRPWVITTEMEPALIRSYAERIGASLEGAAWLERSADESGQVVLSAELPEPGQADGLILDSLNVGGSPEALFEWAEAAAAGLDIPLIVVAQITTDERVRGGEHVPHLAHVVVHCISTDFGRELHVEKNRFGATTSIPWMMPGDQAPRYFYVVEGKRGSMKLTPYPWARSKVWDAVKAEKLDKPDLPAAAAAVWDDLYGGFVEPPDWQARAAFCEARGVTYYKVGYGE